MKRASLSLAIMLLAGAGVLLLQAGRPADSFQPVATHAQHMPAISRASQSNNAVSGAAISHLSKQPLRFEANTGQTDSRVNYLARGNGYTLFLAGGNAVLKLRTSAPLQNPRMAGALSDSTQVDDPQAAPVKESASVLRLELMGANGKSAAFGEEPLPGTSNYFSGASPAQWRTSVADYARVRYHSVYPGIDVLYHASDSTLEYDFDVAPGANPGLIRLKLAGAQRTDVASNGDLVVRVGGAEVRMHKPVIYQETAHGRSVVGGGYTLLAGNEAGFQLGPFDRRLPLVIDPVLAFSTYLGGSERELMFGLALDPTDNVYVCGTTYSTDFPTTAGAIQTSYAGAEDAFVTKLSADGSTLVYSTYLGGSGLDVCDMIAVNSAGNAYITGHTSSADFPVAGHPFQKHLHGHTDAFVAELNPTGTGLVYSSFLGGSQQTFGYGIALDAAGDAYVTGYTISTNFPTVNPIQASNAGKQDAFVTEVNPTGSAMIYSTYMGGSDSDIGYMIAVDSTGAAYIGGRSSSTDFPAIHALQAANHGIINGFVAEIKPGGTRVAFSTYLGGNLRDGVIGLALDGAANIYVTGATTSENFPRRGSHREHLGGRRDAFVSEFAAGGQTLLYSMFLGGNSVDFGESIWADATGDVFVTGCTRSTNFPLKKAVQSTYGGGPKAGDAFITQVRPDGTLKFSTYLGGSDDDAGYAIAADSHNNIYVAGRTASVDFPLVNPLQATPGGGGDDWVALISPN